MKLIVFLKNKKEIVIHDGKHFLRQWHTGTAKILLKSHKGYISRRQIKDFIQARYYNLFKQIFVGLPHSYA